MRPLQFLGPCNNTLKENIPKRTFDFRGKQQGNVDTLGNLVSGYQNETGASVWITSGSEGFTTDILPISTIILQSSRCICFLLDNFVICLFGIAKHGFPINDNLLSQLINPIIRDSLPFFDGANQFGMINMSSYLNYLDAARGTTNNLFPHLYPNVPMVTKLWWKLLLVWLD